MRPTTAFSPRTPGVTAGLVAVVGLLLAGSLALLARIQAEAIATASKLAEVNAQSLADKELLLQEMKHRIKNSISRILAMARHTARGAESTEGFIRSFSDRLEAMARSQDMLTRSRWEQIPLRDLLTAELEQVFGSQMDQCELEGPRVMLQPGHAQALGLTFHELATNALKYGSISEAEGRLNVGWKMTGGRNSPELELVWEEIGAREITAPSGTGFGSQLIRANLEGELGGRLDVQFAEMGVRVQMRVPFAPPEPAPRRRRGKKGQGKSAGGHDKSEVRPESTG
jgi:two-component sensor histidine kinase